MSNVTAELASVKFWFLLLRFKSYMLLHNYYIS